VNGDRAYKGAVKGFSALFVVVGILLIVVTLSNGGGPAAVGFLMGIAFFAVGLGRLWISSRMGREE
jgi:hypothetical protein